MLELRVPVLDTGGGLCKQAFPLGMRPAGYNS